jgi:tetratricopeptide (TPR) repeat protein
MTTANRPRWIVAVLGILALVAAAVKLSAGQEAPAASDIPDVHLGKGYDALKQDKYEVAASEFQAALNLDPKLVLKARFPLAVAFFEMHKGSDARRELEAVRNEVGDHPNVLYYLGRLDLEDRKFESAIQNLTKAAAKPPFPDTAYYLGFAYFKQNDLAAAEKWLTEAARLTPRDSRVPYQLGLVYRKQGRTEEADKATALSAELRRRDDSEGRLKLECAQKLDSGLREEARAVCDQLYDPDDAERLTALGTLYGQHGQLELALKPLRRAAELAPQSPQMQYNLALVYFQMNQFENARTPLAAAVKRWPDLFQLNALYGAVLVKLGEDVQAHGALHHAHQLNPQDSATEDLLYSTTLRIGRKLQSERRYSECLRYFVEAAALRPNDPEPHRRMAEIYAATKRPRQALDERQTADRLTNVQ